MYGSGFPKVSDLEGFAGFSGFQGAYLVQGPRVQHVGS